ncbi:MAG: prepilin-type N-terminal cleavage/methylation domain-containing protein [Deltaproteobacteria bacterium]|nr:prepilin-type N-terminal cleavage/methylation domain-containing protein [Deltaproteobacteria bacterium]
MLNGHSKGFTLLELLIALTITAVIVVITFGALRIGIRAWEKGEKDVDIRQRQRIVLDLIKRQLASTCVSDVWGRDQQLLSLKGDNKSIAFVSHIPMVPGNRFGLVHVQYAVKQEKGGGKEHLTFYEKNIALPDKSAGNPDEGDFSELLPGMKSIVFEYLKNRPGEEASLWQKSWDPAVDKGVPRAVRVTFEENDEKTPIYVIAGAGE